MRSLPDKALIAVIAVGALPGSPLFNMDSARLVAEAEAVARAYKAVGVDGILIENSWDVPYIKPPLPDEAIEIFCRAIKAVRGVWNGPTGLQLLEGANEQALRVAHTFRLDFIRVEGYVFAHVGGAGIIEGCAGTLLRLRRELRADNVAVFADIQKKHCAHMLTGDLSIADHAYQARLFLADGLIVTGRFTGQPPTAEDLNTVQPVAGKACPVAIGSGITVENLSHFMPLADVFIVGSALRENGQFLAPTDPDRVKRFADTFRTLRGH